MFHSRGSRVINASIFKGLRLCRRPLNSTGCSLVLFFFKSRCFYRNQYHEPCKSRALWPIFYDGHDFVWFSKKYDFLVAKSVKKQENSMVFNDFRVTTRCSQGAQIDEFWCPESILAIVFYRCSCFCVERFNFVEVLKSMKNHWFYQCKLMWAAYNKHFFLYVLYCFLYFCSDILTILCFFIDLLGGLEKTPFGVIKN